MAKFRSARKNFDFCSDQVLSIQALRLSYTTLTECGGSSDCGMLPWTRQEPATTIISVNPASKG